MGRDRRGGDRRASRSAVAASLAALVGEVREGGARGTDGGGPGRKWAVGTGVRVLVPLGRACHELRERRNFI